MLLHGLLVEIALSTPREPQRTLHVIRALNAYRQPNAAHRRRIAARSAAAIIEARFAEALDVSALAEEIDCHPTTLRRAFRRTFKMSLRQYHARARVRAAFRLFQQGTADVLAVARQVGYFSEKNLYRTVRALTGGTVAELREAALRDHASPMSTIGDDAFSAFRVESQN